MILHVYLKFYLHYRLLENFKEFQSHMESALLEIFYPDAVDEWITCNMAREMEQLTKLVKNAELLLSIGAKPKSTPIDEDPLVIQ